MAGLFSKALGPENVIGVTMPCHSREDDKLDAKLVSDYYGFELINFDLTSVYDTFKNDLDNLFFSDLSAFNFLSPSLHKVSYSITFSTFSVSLNLFFSESMISSGFSLNNFISNNILSPKIFYTNINMI